MADSTEAANQAAADNFKAGLKWLQTPEAAKLSAAAKAKALSYFKQRYPNANMGAFEVQVTFDKNHKATGEVFFNEGGGLLQSVFGADRKYWPQAMISVVYAGNECNRNRL